MATTRVQGVVRAMEHTERYGDYGGHRGWVTRAKGGAREQLERLWGALGDQRAWGGHGALWGYTGGTEAAGDKGVWDLYKVCWVPVPRPPKAKVNV